MNESKPFPNDAKKQFRKLGACSHTMAFLLNRQYGHQNRNAEKAADPLAGGINRQGYQCGMLWGATLAAGAESYRRYGANSTAIGMAIVSSQEILRLFLENVKSPDCIDITDCNWNSKIDMAKFFITGRFRSCFKLIEKWAPQAFNTAEQALASNPPVFSTQPVSCASEVIRKLGGTEEEATMVAGFAGGIGLSGNACGALAAAIWYDALLYYRNQTGKKMYDMERGSKVLDKFYKASDYEILCSKLCGKLFTSIDEHSQHVCSGGCEKLIWALTEQHKECGQRKP